MTKFTNKEQNMINTAKAVLEERGYNVTTIVKDAYNCSNVMISNPHGSEYPDANGCTIFPSGRTSKEQFRFIWQ